MSAIRRFVAPICAIATATAIASNTIQLPAHAAAITFSGRCIAVSDGDTIKVLHDGMAEKVRLIGIDCPKKRQAFGLRAKQFTAELAFDQVVTVSSHSKDRYGRLLGDVVLPDGRDLNAELVKHGYAWWYRKFSKDEHLHALEAQAQRERIGLWAASNPEPPWDFRHHPSGVEHVAKAPLVVPQRLLN